MITPRYPGKLWTPQYGVSRARGGASLDIDFFYSLTPRIAAGDPTSIFARDSIANRDYWSGSSRLVEEKAVDAYRPVYRKDSNGLYIEAIQLEPEVLNLFTQNTDLTQFSTTRTSVTNTPTTTSPQNVSTVYNVLRDTGGIGLHKAHRSATLVDTNEYIFGSWIKQIQTVTYTWMRLYSQLPTNAAICYFDLTNNAIGATPANCIDRGIIVYGNGWIFPWIKYVSTGSGGYNHHVGICNGDESPSYTSGAFDAFYVDRPMVHLGDYPTSLIETVAATVTREPESLSYVADNNIGGQNIAKGTFTFPFHFPTYTPAANIELVKISDGGDSNNSIKIVLDTDGYLNATTAKTAGNAGAVQIAADHCVDQKKELICRFRNNQLDLAVKDVDTGTVTEGTADTSCDIPVGLDTIDFGPLDVGCIGRYRHFPEYEANVNRYWL